MKDITRAFEKWCESKNISYNYGQRANLNLLNGNCVDSKVYFLHDTNIRRINGNEFGSNGITFSGVFFLVVKSDLDQPYYKEVESTNGNKYECNIEPLLKYVDELKQHFYCTDYTITSLEIRDVTDLLDLNTDGLLINYTITHV